MEGGGNSHGVQVSQQCLHLVLPGHEAPHETQTLLRVLEGGAGTLLHLLRLPQVSGRRNTVITL